MAKKLSKKEIAKRKKETVVVFGMKVPAWGDCQDCGAEQVCKFEANIGPSKRCTECAIKWYEENEKNRPTSKGPALMRHKDVTAIGYDKKTGEPYAVGTKGQKVDIKDTRYKDLRRDPHGWRSVGLTDKWEND